MHQLIEQRGREEQRVTYCCHFLESSEHPSIVVRRNDQADTIAVIIGAEGLVATTYNGTT